MSLTVGPSIASAMTVQLCFPACGFAPVGPVVYARCRLVGWDICSVSADAEKFRILKASHLFWGFKPHLSYFPKEIAMPSYFGVGRFFFSVGIITSAVLQEEQDLVICCTCCCMYDPLIEVATSSVVLGFILDP